MQENGKWDPRGTHKTWDFQIVQPLVLKYLENRSWPAFVSLTAIKDVIEADPSVPSRRIVMMEWDIAHALNNYGYCRTSRIGRGFVRASPGIQLIPEPAEMREIRGIAV